MQSPPNPLFPTPAEIARDVIRNPAAFHGQPAVLASAWATLMEARGNRVNLDHIGPPAHRVVPDMIPPLQDEATLRSARVSARVAQIAQQKGLFQPPLDGVPA